MLLKKYNKQYRDVLIYFPGWATDERVLLLMDLPYQLWTVSSPIYPGVIACLMGGLKTITSDQKVFVLGVSMGGYVALSLYEAQLPFISHYFIWGVRPFYPLADIRLVQRLMRKDKGLFLKQFYKNSFTKVCFDSHYSLFNDYVDSLNDSYLEDGLIFLESVQLKPYEYQKDLTFCHGDEDLVAPISELKVLFEQGAEHVVVFSGYGHLPFLDLAFTSLFKTFLNSF